MEKIEFHTITSWRPSLKANVKNDYVSRLLMAWKKLNIAIQTEVLLGKNTTFKKEFTGAIGTSITLEFIRDSHSFN